MTSLCWHSFYPTAEPCHPILYPLCMWIFSMTPSQGNVREFHKITSKLGNFQFLCRLQSEIEFCLHKIKLCHFQTFFLLPCLQLVDDLLFSLLIYSQKLPWKHIVIFSSTSVIGLVLISPILVAKYSFDYKEISFQDNYPDLDVKLGFRFSFM